MLPQFTLNARIIFFMMVMFATATTASLKKTNDVVIMLKNHERALHVNAGGKVTATDISLAQFFSMESVGDIFSDTFKIALYAKEVGRYLCFRRGKLVGMKNLTRDCHFIESLDHGYFLYANAYNPLWRVGFTKGLKPVGPRHWKRPQTLKRACFLFVKINAEHFDRSRFTTTTTVAPSTRPAATAVTLREGHKLHDSKASIIDSNSNNYKRTKSANNNSGKRQFQINRENLNATGGRNRHRKRKHHAKLAAINGNNGGSSSILQPKNLVRHHHDQGNGEGRRRQHQREEKERKLRLKNQRRQHQEHQNATLESEPMPNATNSATPSMAATTLAATASLAPSALNIVAMLAAGRRKRGRRKKPADSSVTNLSSNSGHHQAMDLQLVAQSPLQAQSQYDRIQLDTIKLRNRHEHNYHQQQQQQQQQQTIAPVSSISPSKKEVIQVQQQNHKYSNINTNSQLYKSSSSNSRSRSSSSSRPYSSNNNNSISSINSHYLSHKYNLNFKPNVYNINLNNKNNNNNNNDTINAIPALPKKYLSKNNFNHEYLMQQTTRSSTDFKTKQNSNHSSHSSRIKRSDPSHTSHDFKNVFFTDNDYNDSKSDSDTFKHENNSNRLLVNNSNIRDNNLQQEHLINRFKLIYVDRIRSHNIKFNLNFKNNNKSNMPHYNNYNEHVENNSPISSTTTNKESHSILESFQERSDVSTTIEFKASNNNNSNSKGNKSVVGRTSSRSIKNSSISKSNLKAFTTSDYNHSRRRTKRILINNYITNNKNNNNNNHNNNNIYDTDENQDYIVNNYNKKYAKIKSSAGRRSSSNINSHISRSGSDKRISSSNSLDSNNKNINVLQNNYDNKANTLKYGKQNSFKSLMTATTVNRNSKLLTILGRQQQQILKLINNPIKYNYNNYKDIDYEQDDDGEKFKQIQNKYEKIIVQYRSVFNCLETCSM